MLRSIFICAVIAGGAAGIAASALHTLIVFPIDLQLESLREVGRYGHGPHESLLHHHLLALAQWDEASLTSSVFSGGDRNMLMMIMIGQLGFAFILSVTAELTGGLEHWRDGFGWGGAGFLIFCFVPAIGMPPEIPGTVTNDFLSSQLWWLSAAVFTSASLLTLYLEEDVLRWPLAGVLAAIPFIIGPPQPVDHLSGIPNHLQIQFAATTLAASLASWLFLACLMGWLRSRAEIRNLS